jgi:hypothetical protein
MRYALNAAPINGWQTFNGVGSSSMVVAASGGALAADLGVGASEMAMAASGDAASVELGVGTADLSMVATGDAKEATLGTAAAAMAMSAAGNAADVQPAAGAAAMLMGLVHGIPYKPIPAGFVANKRDRTMRVPQDDRRFTVAPDVQYRIRPERALRVARESRSV